MKSTTVTTDRFNPIALVVLIVLFGISIGLFYVKLISDVALIALLVVSAIAAASVRIATSGRRPWFFGWGNTRG